jgi:hypothetical protein
LSIQFEIQKDINLSALPAVKDVNDFLIKKSENPEILPLTLYCVVSTSKEYNLKLQHLIDVGSFDTSLLKTSALINCHGKVKNFAKNSLFCLSVDYKVRRFIIQLIESK